MPTPASNVLRFGVFELDAGSGELRRNGLKIRLPDQSFQVLKALLSRPGELVTRDELQHVLWSSDTFVDFEVGLNSAVRKLREALDDAADNPRFVETLPRRGYRFVAPVSPPAADTAVAFEPAGLQPGAPTAPLPATAVPALRRLTAPLSRTAVLLLTASVAAVGGLYQGVGLGPRVAPAVEPIRSPVVLPGRAAHAIDPRAYDAYLKGLTAKGLQRFEGFQRAIGYFEEAVAIQPDFGEAYAALAHSQLQFLFGGPLSPHETMPKAEAAARKALQLDDTLSQAHWALGQILSLYHWRWEEGAASLQRADALRGKDELTSAVSESLIRRGRLTEAIAAAERGRTLDGRSLNAQMAVGSAYRAAGQHDRALNELRRALDMSPGNTRVRFQIGITYVMMGRLEDAIREFETALRTAQGHNSRMEAYLGYAYAAARRSGDAEKILQELESHRRDQYVSSFGTALIHDALGRKAPALAALQRAYEDRAVEFAQMTQYPPFKTIAADPGFHAVMQKVGLRR
jgi:DNA-binding winged helix-turn-helix (wHTH) protein/tetratricopeptide (TPR) repeat protein